MGKVVMGRSRLYPWLFALLAGAAVLLLVGRCSGPEAEVRRRLDELAELLSKEGAESALEQAAKGRRLGSFFSRSFSVDLGEYGRVDRVGEVARLAAGYRQRYDRMEVVFKDPETVVTGDIATTVVLAAVSAREIGLGRQERYSLRLEWRREGGEWRLSQLLLLQELAGSARRQLPGRPLTRGRD